ncbi:MAG: hypothetical protein E7280_09025 [Lachnospiraceae bacterium]|nr:hypothetical protein [Lachnospiraceae bacterium]
MRKTKRFVGVLLSFMLILAGFPQMKAKAAEPQSVEYLDEAGVRQTCTAAYAVDAVANEWGISETTTWLFVSRSMVIEDIRPSVKGTVNLILYDGAELVVRKGITVSVGNALNIFCQSAGTGQLLAGGHYEGGTLQIDCENGFAGIGGSYRTSTGNIAINGGVITAAGGSMGAGIGGGLEEAGGNITINGGTVNAISKEFGAGIGGGQKGAGGTITIKGGRVSATGKSLGAGIGGGDQGEGGTITITKGEVTATGGEYGAGIGGGSLKAGGTINIDGGTITANGGTSSAGIGGGSIGAGGNITITGGEVTATGTTYGAGIGGGHEGEGGNITISGGNVTAQGGDGTGIGDGGAGIGGGYNKAGGTITISEGTVTATGGGGAAGIGGGANGTGGNITINGGTVSATGGDDQNRAYSGAGIGGGDSGAGETINISGGEVTATGGLWGAGIGGGCEGSGGNVTITGGNVIATGGRVAMGIGAGDGGNSQGTLTVAPSSRVFADINPIVGMPSNLEKSANGDNKIDEINLCQYMKVVNAYKYLDWDETDKKTVEKMISFSSCSNVAAGESAWNNGWYVVKEDVVIDHRVTVTGMVHLLLCDGATLIAKKGITVADRNSLTIYGQSEGDGLLCAGIYSESGQLMPVCDSYNAGIGGGNGENGGNITVHGGEVYACGGEYAAGIGGGFGGAGGTFRISGGQVCGYGGNLAAGIGGGGNGGAGGTINIFGGSIEAVGGAGAAGIGGGYNGDGGRIDISSGEVIALGGDYGGYAIGCGCPEEGTRLTANISFGEVKVSIFDGTTNEKKPQKASDRLAACAYGRVSVEPCAHDSKVGNSCKYCGCQLGGSTGGEIPFIPEEIITFCTVKFDADGGSAVSDKTVKNGMPIGMLPVTTREGFVFDGWYDGETKWTEETRVSQDVTLKAHWIEDKTILTEDMVTLAFEKKMYSGKKIKPQVTVKKDELILQPDIDYSVTYENNKNIGRARVIITGLGKYTGTVEKTFEITPPKAGSEFTRNNNLYRIVDAEKHTVSFCGTMGRGRIFTRNSIMIGGVSYSVTEIAKKALYKKEGITTLVIGKKVVRIGEKALYGCRNLKKLTFKTTLLKAKTVGENAFGRLSGKLRVEVPEEMKEKYARFFYKKGLAKSIGLNE